MNRKQIVDEYNAKAKAFNDALFTPTEYERNGKYGSRKGDDESREEFAERMRKSFRSMMLLPLSPNFGHDPLI
jgi:hypothetical protein